MHVSNFGINIIPTTPEKQPRQILSNFNPRRTIVPAHYSQSKTSQNPVWKGFLSKTGLNHWNQAR
jgi:hypothetical protein